MELVPWLAGLPAWLVRQRWFGAAGASLRSVRLYDAAALPGTAAAITLVEATLDPGGPVLFQLPAPADFDAAVRACWLRLLHDSATLHGSHGRFAFTRLDGGFDAGLSGELARAEQSNTSIVYRDAGGPRFIGKAFRRLAAGVNPDLEVPLALARHTGFAHIAAPAAQAIYTANGGASFTLGVLQPFVANQGDGWQWALRELRAHPLDADGLAPELALLGRRTGELHLALASIAGVAAFAPEPVTGADLDAWRQRLRRDAAAMAASLRARRLAPELAQRLAVLDPGRFPLARLAGVKKIRLHGDYHLGQVLKAAGDFLVVDFEGEPARPLAERRRKACVLQDVAGMLRSFSYAARAAGAAPGWEANAREAFWNAWRTTLGAASPLLPSEADAARGALAFFECEKALYELRYELDHRPDWVPLPLAGLERLLP